MNKIYLDYLNASPLLPEVYEGMLPFLSNYYGNPQSLHSEGREAKRAIEESRREVALLIGADPEEIYFTSSGSEGNNWVIDGTASAYQKKGNHIVASAIEHISIAAPLKRREGQGGSVTFLPVDPFGHVDPETVKGAITPQTILVTIHHTQSEIGTIQSIQEIVDRIKETGVLFHSDGVSAAGLIPVNVKSLGVDFYTFSAQTAYGPKGVAALYIRKGKKIDPLIAGGGREAGRRAGLENVPGIVGFGIAARLARENDQSRYDRLISLREVLIQEIQKRIPQAYLTGDPVNRLPHHASFYMKGIDGEALVLLLSGKGVAAATGSSCLTGSIKPPSVLTALGLSPLHSRGTLVLSLGWTTTVEKIHEAVKMIKKGVEELKKISP